MRTTISVGLVLLLLCSFKGDELMMEVANIIKISKTDTKETMLIKAAHVVPTPNQFEALKRGYVAMIHFGPNTFTNSEWGTGMEDPNVFSIQNLDTDQWCKSIKEGGMKQVVMVAKHHDGYCLWQSRYTDHGIMSSPFKKGKGDIIRELSNSCRKYGLKLGIYLSPADLYQIENPKGLYGNLSQKTERIIPRPVAGRPFANKKTFKFVVDDYNEYYLNQLFELLTEYGPIDEIWLDGATPKTKGGQTYDRAAWKEVIHALAPTAVIFGQEDLRWVGNEAGKTRVSEWNVIPYQGEPNGATFGADLTASSLGEREELYKADFMHYIPAEVDTSIREGWFYRDEKNQKVRSADDVFDIYERSVGGNAILLLNIPPNREGKFSDTDVKVLKEVGNRISETYSKNLLKDAQGPQKVLDNDILSYELMNSKDNSIIITTPKPIKTNRLIIQEAVSTHSERIEEHALDAWIGGQWQEIAKGTNVGFKRILRFPTLTTTKFRIRILSSRMQAAIANVTAHYYEMRPPQLDFSRDKEGKVSIQPKKEEFRWKPHGEDVLGSVKSDMQIRYTLDGNEPTAKSTVYSAPFLMKSGSVKAVAFSANKKGSTATALFGIIKKDWKPLDVGKQTSKHPIAMAFDEDDQTYWQAEDGKSQSLAIDLGKIYVFKGFTYTPQLKNSEGMIEKGRIEVSTDGLSWRVIEEFNFGNLINDPTQRQFYFKAALKTRYIKVVPMVIAGGKGAATIAEIGLLE
jgi:alpha-L-fucosidase